MSAVAQDRRQCPRQASCSTLFIRTLGEPRLTLHCLAYDISARGLQVQTSMALDEGRPIELWIKLHDQPGTFLLGGHVRWCRDVTGSFLMGITLNEHEHDIDIDSWRALLMPLPTPTEA